MPANILGTQMVAGNIKWRPMTSGLKDPGPSDQTLVVELSGRLSELKGIEGHTFDAAEFRKTCPIAD
jgi:hypothetical protein